MNSKVQIVGGGALGIFLAHFLSRAGIPFKLFDGHKRLGAKLLVAGKGGFNLSREWNSNFPLRYYEHADLFMAWLMQYGPQDLIRDLEQMGIPTFIGTSGKIFPKDLKPVEVLERMLAPISPEAIYTSHELTGLDPEKQELTFKTPSGLQKESYQHLVLALGGPSWPKTGAQSRWMDFLPSVLGIQAYPFRPMNVCVQVPESFQSAFKQYAGQALKNSHLQFGDQRNTHGEMVYTDQGWEGNLIYPFIPGFRKAIESQEECHFILHLKPGLSPIKWREKCAQKGKKSWRKFLTSEIGLSDFQQALFHYHRIRTGQPELQIHLPFSGFGKLDEAISCSGGISMDELDEHLSLKKHPNISVGGEMLEWEAPTGGYLLQACFTMAKVIEKRIIEQQKSAS